MIATSAKTSSKKPAVILIADDSNMNPVYRAYRVPYDWIPQAAKPEEKAIKRIDNGKFRVPGSPRRKAVQKTTPVKTGKKTARFEGQFCVIPVDKE